jgi:hypothetical protein
MVIKGKVSHVLETWPLQLVVQTEQGRYDITLSEDTRVVRNQAQVSPGELRPGLTVEISCSGVAPRLTAETIRIA